MPSRSVPFRSFPRPPCGHRPSHQSVEPVSRVQQITIWVVGVCAVACFLLAGCGVESGSSQAPAEASGADARSASRQPASAAVPDTASIALPDSALVPSPETARRFRTAMQFAVSHGLKDEPVGRVMQEVGQTFAAAPYLEGTLDAPPTEELVVRLDGFDCVTYVETLLAMARGIVQRDTTYAGFARRLARIRYRAGAPMGYCSRLHYFSDWIRDNDARQVVRDLAPDLGGRTFRDTLDFVSTHRDAYSRFATNDSLLACVQDAEAAWADVTRSQPMRYVPQDSIHAVYDDLRAGDVIAIVTSVEGLDIAHTGLAYVPPDTSAVGGVGLLHASLSDGVVVSPDLQRYVQQIGHMIGIVVARPQPPASSRPAASS